MIINFYGRYQGQQNDDAYSYHFENLPKEKLKSLICDSNPIGAPWKEATISRVDESDTQELIIISSVEGYFLIQCGNEDRFALWDEALIREIIRPDEFEFPRGCVLPVPVAWKAVSFFADTGTLSKRLTWISWGDIPEDASWIEC